MSAAQENIFGKIRGRWDEEAARMAVNNRRLEMVRALVAMSNEDLSAFIGEVNAAHYKPANRTLKVQFVRSP